MIPGRIRFVREWCDLRVGVFWDRKKRWLYVLPVPCLGLRLEWPQRVFRVTNGDESFSCESYHDHFLLRPENGAKPWRTVELSMHGLRKC